MVLAGYSLLALLMTYPLVVRLSSHLAGSGDDMWLFQWNNWWLRKALFERLNPYFTTYMFYPQGVSLVYHNFSWLNTGIWLVLEPLVGSIAAYNVTFLLTFILSGTTTYILIAYLTHSRPAAFVAGLVFAFSPYHLSHFNHPNLISVQWLPLCVLFLMRTVREGSQWSDVLFCIASLVLTALSRWQLLTFAAILMVLYLGYSLAFEREHWNRQTVLALLAIGLGAAVCIGLLLFPLLSSTVKGATSDEMLMEEQQDWAQTDLLAYIVPNRLHPLFGPLVAPLYERFRKNRGEIAFLGYSVLLLAGYGAVRARRNALYWVLSASCLVLLALGPILRLNGRLYPAFPMPYRLVGWLLPIQAMRFPDRFNVMVSLPLAVLAGYGLTDIHKRLSCIHRLATVRWWRTVTVGGSSVVLAFLVLFEYLSIPLPTVAPSISPFYQDLARDEGDYAILEVPMGRGYSKAYMFLQTFHGKRLVEGHVSRTPPGAYDTITHNPMLASLSERSDLDTNRCDLSRQLNSLAADNIRAIVIHKVDVPSDRLAIWRDYLTINPYYEDDGLVVYRTHPTMQQDFEMASALGGGLALVRATVAPTHTTQGGTVWIDLRWTATQTPAGDYAARLALVNLAGQVVQETSAPPCGDWPTSAWGRDALAVDRRQLQVDPYLVPSAYRLTLSAVETQSGQVLTPTQDIAIVEVEALERHFTAPPMLKSINATFEQAMTLLGYDLRQEASTLRLTLHWQALHRLGYYKIFVHLYDAQSGDLARQSDAVPRNWMYPTNWWEAGEVVSDDVVLDLSGLAVGRYQLAVGVYEPGTGARLRLPSGQDHLVLEKEIVLP
jgi:hypothetical protein